MNTTAASPERWRVLCHRIGLDPKWAALRYKMIIGAYGEKHRAYHTLSHISYCLRMLNEHRALAHNFDAIEYALWFHDFAYHTQPRPKGSVSNELLSAEIADELLRDDGVAMPFREQVHGLIVATLHTPETTHTADEKLIADIDWSPVGAPWEEFRQNGRDIRKEWMHYSDDEFRIGRIAWLNSALKRPEQFHLPQFKAQYEIQARDNIFRAFDELLWKHMLHK